jgi:hypothetical protein
MALPEVGNVAYPTPTDVLNQLLADLRFGYDQIGVTVNVRPNSDHWLRMRAVANRISIAIANNQISAAAFNPLTATGDDLDALAGVFGVVRRGASQAAGLVAVGVTGGGSVLIPAGFLATSAAGNEYETETASTVADGELVSVISVGAGTDQNLAADDVVTWNSAAIGSLAQTATVDAGEIDGGNEEDDDATLRARLIQRLSFPAVGGNPSQVSDFAEDATAAVERAFVYSAVRGPGSYDVAVTTAGGDRTLSSANLDLVSSAILSQLPGHTDLNLTSVTTELVNVVIDMALPLPVNAGGSGGGFRDATPWPSDLESGVNVFAEVDSVDTTLNTITVNSTSADPPVAGRRFAIWDPTKDNGEGEDAGGFQEFTILSVAGSSGAYVLTVDTSQSGSLAFVVGGMLISAGAERLIDYGAAIRDAIALLGPGEKTASPDILPRGRRRPEPAVAFPSELTTIQLAPLIDPDDGFSEIQDVRYAARFRDGTGDGGAGTGTFEELTQPGIPPTTADPPKILVLQNLSIRAKVA